MPSYLKRARKVEERIEAMGVVPQPPRQKLKEMVWQCRHCDALNPATVYYKCENCGAAR